MQSMMKQIKSKINVPIGLHWYGNLKLYFLRKNLHFKLVWDQINFDTNYPKYFPPKEGFYEVTQQFENDQIHVVPYINGRIFDKGQEIWKKDNAEKFCCKYTEAKLNGTLIE